MLATFVATMGDTGYWRLDSINFGGFGPLFGMAIFILVFTGTFQVVYVSPIITLLLFVWSYTRDRRYMLAGITEFLLSLAHLFIAMPLYQ